MVTWWQVVLIVVALGVMGRASVYLIARWFASFAEKKGLCPSCYKLPAEYALPDDSARACEQCMRRIWRSSFDKAVERRAIVRIEELP